MNWSKSCPAAAGSSGSRTDRHEEQRDQRHAADELDEADREHPDDRHARAPSQRQHDADGQREHDADESGDQVEHEAAELIRSHDFEAEAADQQDRGDHGIGEREPAPVAGIRQLVEQHVAERRHQQGDADIHTPIGIGWVEAVEELGDTLVQPGPARAFAGAVLADLARKRRVDEGPLDQARYDQRENGDRRDRERRTQVVGEEVGPQPADDTSAGDRRRTLRQHRRPAAMEGVLAHRSTSAMRLLYQFMKADVSRLNTR